MEAALSQLSMHHAELALRMVVGVVLGGVIGWERKLAGAIGVAAGAGLYAVAVFITTLSFVILYGLRTRPPQRRSDGHQRAEVNEEGPKS